MNIKLESIDAGFKLESVSDDDLAKINKSTLGTMTADDVTTFRARVVDGNNPTANKRIWTADWQKANLESLIGVPFTEGHFDEQGRLAGQRQVVGRVFDAELRDGATYVKGFIPVKTPEGEIAKTRLECGKYLGVSIAADAADDVRDDGFNYILPSDVDHVHHFAFVTDPGCQTCSIVTEECEEPDAKTEAMLDFAEEQMKDLKAEYVRLSAFNLGTGISKTVYESAADAVDPKALKAMVGDLRKAELDKVSEQDRETIQEPLDRLAEQIEAMREERGV